MPLTHYERTQKFASSEYGTVSQRLAGHSQYQIGDCALTTQRLLPDDTDDPDSSSTVVLCSPSGYLYAESAILEYLLQKTQECKAALQAAHDIEQQKANTADDDIEQKKKRAISDFQESQKVVKKSRAESAKDAAVNDLNRVSYWLSSAQPNANTKNASAANAIMTATTDNNINTPTPQPPDRPVSPMTGHELRRKDLWPVKLHWLSSPPQQTNNSNRNKKVLCCSVSEKVIPVGAAVTAYWTSATHGRRHRRSDENDNPPGVLVLQTVYDELQLGETKRCPLTDRMIRCTRTLQKSGSSFAASGQSVQAAQYRPTIT